MPAFLCNVIYMFEIK